MKIAFEYPALLLGLALLYCFFACKRETLRIYFPKVAFLPSFQLRSIPIPALVFALLVIGAAGPFTYSHIAQTNKKGRNLVLALDASGSMEGALQGEKSKFELVKELVQNFISHRHDDNIGVVVFGSFAYIASPITYDLASLRFLIDYLETGIAGNNTAIGEAIDQALRAIQAQKAKNNVILLITDGHHNSGAISPKEAVEKAKKMGVRIYTIGLGDADRKHLARIAKESGGAFFFVHDAQELKDVFAKIDSLEPSPLRGGEYENKRALYFLPVAMAILLLLYETVRGRE